MIILCEYLLTIQSFPKRILTELPVEVNVESVDETMTSVQSHTA
jgi:hypothetical protein